MGSEASNIALMYFVIGKIYCRSVKNHLYLQFAAGNGGSSIIPTAHIMTE